MENQQELKVEYIDIEKIIPYDKNPRNNSPAVEACAASIRDYGFGQPISVDENMVIISGHTRRLAALKIGMEKIPCIVRRDLTPEQVRAYRVVDNKIAELSEWNEELLAQEIAALPEFNFADYGFDISELTDMTDGGGMTDADAVPEVSDDDPPKSKRGEVYQMGDHRLMCGDSTSAADVARLMDGKKAKLLLTDPPYGISVVKGKKVCGGGALHFGKVGGGHIVDSRVYSEVIGDDTTDTAKANYQITKEYAENQVIFGGNYFTDFLSPSRCWIVWDKENTGNFADAELAWTSFDKGVKLYHFMWNGLAREGSKKEEGVTRVHPTQKPVGLMAKILADFCLEGGLVIDCFGGSGSTLIACEQTGRNCYMMEIDPHYCDVIRKRWAEFVHGEGCDWEALTPVCTGGEGTTAPGEGAAE